ncbi:hypothetical protein HY745_02300, partial [Candidatus Desantisbacteria bacterium]|nr:hypothetical protein [Candidatus Desantisbacteria bacterium]
GDAEEENLDAVRTQSGSVMEKGKTGAGFIYQYLNFVAYKGFDLRTAFINEGKYNFRKYEVGKSYFVSHGVTDKMTLSLYINDFFIEEKYFTWTDTNKNSRIDEKTDTIENITNTYRDLAQVWIQSNYQLSKESNNFKLAVNNILMLPTGYEEKVSSNGTVVYLGFSFSQKIMKSFFMGNIGYSYYGITSTINERTGNSFQYYPGDAIACRLAVTYPFSTKITAGGELIGSYYFKPKTSSGEVFGEQYDGIDFSPMVKFKITPNTVFYSSISYKLRDNLPWGYDYGYIFGLNYLFE